MLLYLVQIAGVISVTLLVWYLYYQYCYLYWKKKGVPTEPPTFPAGNIGESLSRKKNLYCSLQDLYQNFKSKGIKQAGLYFFNGPIYFPIDTEIIGKILTTDFEHFEHRGTYYNEEEHPISLHLISLRGERWKTLRTKLTPMFTPAKLKSMYNEIFLKYAEALIERVKSITEQTNEVDIKQVLNDYTTDIIGSSGFGIEFKALEEGGSELLKSVHSLFRVSRWKIIKIMLTEGLKNPGNLMKLLVDNKDTEDLIVDIVTKTMKFREDNKIVTNDFLSLLMEIREKVGLTFNEIISQSFVYLVAGYETSSSTMTYCIHELAHNLEIQERLRQEIYENLGHDLRAYTYEGISKLPLLDQVLKETLRIYPAIGMLNRICTKKYQVPGTEVVIDEGTPVIISNLGIQRDPDYFPEPLEFRPERFSDESSIENFTYLPFGSGPRYCLAMRYGQIQSKLGIASLISQFKFSPDKNTPRHVYFDKSAMSFVLGIKNGFFVNVAKL